MQKLRSVQVLRGLAACAVVALHVRFYAGPGIEHSVTRLGAAGVDLFFVISGFIMATIAKPSPGRFLFDRAWRIFPLWLIAVTPWILINHSTGPELISSLTLWPVYKHFTPPALALGWSLSFELLFYAAIALAMMTRPIVPLALFAATLLGKALTGWSIFNYLGNPMIFEFLAGVLIARLPRDSRFAIPLLAVSVIGFAIAPLALYRADVAVDAAVSGWRALCWGFPAALLVYSALCSARLFNKRVFDPFVTLGDASYSIYLFHRSAIALMTLPLPIEFALSIGAGLAMWRLVERPLLRRPKLVSMSSPASIAA